MWSRWPNSRTWYVVLSAIGMFLQDDQIKLLTDKGSPTSKFAQIKVPGSRIYQIKVIPDQILLDHSYPGSKFTQIKFSHIILWINVLCDQRSAIYVLCDHCCVKASCPVSLFSQIKVLWIQSSPRSKFREVKILPDSKLWEVKVFPDQSSVKSKFSNIKVLSTPRFWVKVSDR